MWGNIVLELTENDGYIQIKTSQYPNVIDAMWYAYKRQLTIYRILIWRLKSPKTLSFVVDVSEVNNKRITERPHHWSFVRESTGER